MKSMNSESQYGSIFSFLGETKGPFFLTLIVILMSACTTVEKHETTYTNLDYKVQNGRMNPEALWSLGTVGLADVSPDKTKVLYTVSWTDIKENCSHNEIYVMNTDGSGKTQLTFNNKHKKSNVMWRPDGKRIGFVMDGQLWEIEVDGSDSKQITDIEDGIGGFRYSPDMSQILYIKDVVLNPEITTPYADMPKANVKKINDLMYRHWDTYVDGKFSHIFVASYDKTIGEGTDIMEGEKWEAPIRPFSGLEDIIWSPDSKKIVYACRKKVGVDYAISTNSDLYCYNLESGETKNLTEGMMGYDKAPVFSNDGKLLVWESMERDGYEADVVRLAKMDMTTGAVSFYHNDDMNPSGLTFDSANKNIYFTSIWHGRNNIYKYDIANDKAELVASNDCNYGSIADAGKALIATRQAHAYPTEIFKVSKDGQTIDNISEVNAPILEQITMGKTEEHWIKTTDGKEMLVWLILPPNFDPNKKYPTLLYCQGGPQSPLSQFWSKRWNFQNFVANDYIIVAPSRRGMPGFGREWNEAISKDYGGQCMRDYLSAIDFFAKKPYVDEDRLGAIGASFGGFSVFWLAGNHEGRFKTFVSHDGIFNSESMYLETEEMWFVDWDMGGNFWDKTNDAAKYNTYSQSPHRFVQNWDTPIMVIHGSRDFRIPDTQGMQAFNVARLLGIPAEYLNFPEENHWVLGAQNGIVWQRSVVEWLDKWLKASPPTPPKEGSFDSGIRRMETGIQNS